LGICAYSFGCSPLFSCPLTQFYVGFLDPVRILLFFAFPLAGVCFFSPDPLFFTAFLSSALPDFIFLTTPIEERPLQFFCLRILFSPSLGGVFFLAPPFFPPPSLGHLPLASFFAMLCHRRFHFPLLFETRIFHRPLDVGPSLNFFSSFSSPPIVHLGHFEVRMF